MAIPSITPKSRFGDCVVAFGLATRKEVDSAMKGLRSGEMLGHALSRVKPKTCDHDTMNAVARVEKLYRETARKLAVPVVLNKSSFIGDILVALGLVSLEVKEEVLAYQTRERAAGRDPGMLGGLLISHPNGCSADDVELGMKVQRWLRGVK